MNTNQPIIRLALPTPLRRLFDYLPPDEVAISNLIKGMRVSVPFQNRKLVGVIMELAPHSTIPHGKLKKAHAILDESSLFTDDVLKLCEWAADYYHYSLGEVLATALPSLLRKDQSLKLDAKKTIREINQDNAPQLNDDQKLAIQKIHDASHLFKVFLLNGITGSGKTEVYLHAIQQKLNENQQVLVLVPEISLTPQTLARFHARFDVPIVALHSNLNNKTRLKAWLSAKSGEAKIVIGTRSAIFTPFAKLGLIIVDEEHDNSFKQQDRFRYHARDLSVMRANINQIPVVLGSATPSLESLFNVKRQRYELISLPKRAGNAKLPQCEIIDLRHAKVDEGLSEILLNRMQDHLTLNQQVMLFLNRRGFAPVLYCTECKYIVNCKRCDARMVYHKSPLKLQCHHCDSQMKIPNTCEKCLKPSLNPIGLGTQRLEAALEKHFPHIPILRFDRDTTKRKNALQDLLNQINEPEPLILLGTQMLAKGHHFPHVTLVGMIDADAGLFSSDFRAIEQMGQLLIQVSGRAGRENKIGSVLIQTRHPEHPQLQLLINQGFSAFAEELLIEREQSLLPPHAHLALFKAESYIEKHAVIFLNAIKSFCVKDKENILIFGPASAMIARKKGLHCHQLILKCQNRNKLQQLLKLIIHHIDELLPTKSIKWTLDVDPVEM